MIGIITYDHPHRKTQDLVSQLIMHGKRDLCLIATPFIVRNNFKPVFQHRPTRVVNLPVQTMCTNLGIDYTKTEMDAMDTVLRALQPDIILIAGAGILPLEVASNHAIINSHPGMLPYVKGLDALKWAIYDGHPIGVTTHFISEKTDEGKVIDRREVPIYREDTFHSIAYRQYEIELEMLVAATNTGSVEYPDIDLSIPGYPPHRRMPNDLEVVMMERLKKRLDQSPIFK